MPFQHPHLAPLHRLLAQERRTHPDDLSAANVVAHRLLQGPYLRPSHADWHLVEVAEQEWRLAQRLPDGQWARRDPLEPFYPDDYWHPDLDSNQNSDHFSVQPRRETLPVQAWETGPAPVLSPAVEQAAQGLLDRLTRFSPDALQRLLEPTTEQLAQRRALALECLSARDLNAFLIERLGEGADLSLRAHGIDYHTAPSFQTPSTTLFLVAHNGEDVAGLMKLGNGSGWGYGVGYVCVAPGFRNQRLSLRLYQAAIARCLQDQKVLIRSDPGDQTPPQATLAYDRLVLNSPVLHTTFHSPAEQGFRLLHEKGIPYQQWLDALKPACDAAVRTPQQRMEGHHMASYQQRKDWVAQHGSAFDGLLKDPQPKPRRPRP